MSYQKRKGITVEDVAYAGRSKNQVFMNPNPGKLTPDELAAANAVKLIGQKTGFEAENNNRVKYNEQLLDLDPRFSNLIPLNSFIVRYALLVEQTMSKIIVPVTGDVVIPSRSGQLKEVVKDPYRFKQEAVIVSVPQYETELKPGMRVQCVGPRLVDDHGEIVGYDVEYLHPDYEQKRGPQNPTHADFGYAIVNRTYIKVIINDTPRNTEAVAE